MRRGLNTAGQAPLDFNAPPSPAPVASLVNVQQLINALKSGAGLTAEALAKQEGWVSADELAAVLQWSDRKVRAVARVTVPGVVSYPGSPGYKLWEQCSVEEIDRAIDAFKSQAKDMTARAMLYESAYHSRFRGTRA